MLTKHLNKKQIDTRPIFYPLHIMPPYSEFSSSKSMKNSLDASSKGICLPSSATLVSRDVNRIIRALDDAVKTQLNV